MKINTLTILISTLLVWSLTETLGARSPSSSPSPSPESAEVKTYLVLTQAPEGDPKSYYTSILSRVLGSEEAAEKALVYTYNDVVTGFAATINGEEARVLSKQPGVVQVFLGGTSTIDPHKIN